MSNVIQMTARTYRACLRPELINLAADMLAPLRTHEDPLGVFFTIIDRTGPSASFEKPFLDDVTERDLHNLFGDASAWSAEGAMLAAAIYALGQPEPVSEASANAYAFCDDFSLIGIGFEWLEKRGLDVGGAA